MKGCNGIGDCILGKSLGVGLGDMDHFFRIDFNRFIMKFGLGDCLQTMGALRQVGISIDPRVAVKMGDVAAIILVALITDAQLSSKVDGVSGTAGLNERVVEHVAVEGCDYCGFVGLDEIGKSNQCLLLGRLVVDSHVAGKLFGWGVVKLLHVVTAKTTVYYQERLPFVHQ